MPSNKFVYPFFWLSMHILKFMQSPESETVIFIEIAYFFYRLWRPEAHSNRSKTSKLKLYVRNVKDFNYLR